MTTLPAPAPILFETLPTRSGHALGLVVLNQPQALNGFSLEMALALQEKLLEWEADPSLVMVILRGSGEKAFCAGGDLQSIYKSLPAVPAENAWTNDYLKTFFQVEYAVDHHIHVYAKPVLCWAHGIVMGGGAGLMMGASHKVGTPATRFAMQETTIGLFPDVGGSWLLNRLPAGVGRFLAMTGTSIGAADAQSLGVIDHLLPAGAWATLLETLAAVHWEKDRRHNDHLLDACLESLALTVSETGPVQRHMSAMSQWCAGTNGLTIYRRLAALASSDDPWLAQAAIRLGKACPAAVALSFEMLKRARPLSLAQVFQMEYIVAMNGTARSDFREGIRALLIEKTNDPRWSPASVDEVSTALIDSFFIPPWPNGVVHPLGSLDVTAG